MAQQVTYDSNKKLQQALEMANAGDTEGAIKLYGGNLPEGLVQNMQRANKCMALNLDSGLPLRLNTRAFDHLNFNDNLNLSHVNRRCLEVFRNWKADKLVRNDFPSFLRYASQTQGSKSTSDILMHLLCLNSEERLALYEKMRPAFSNVHTLTLPSLDLGDVAITLCPKLRKLTVTGPLFWEESLVELPNIEELVLNNLKFSDIYTGALSINLTNVKKITLDASRIVWTQLYDSIKLYFPNIKELIFKYGCPSTPKLAELRTLRPDLRIYCDFGVINWSYDEFSRTYPGCKEAFIHMLLMLITEKQDLEKAQVFAERRSCLITGKTDPVTYNTQIDLWIEEARERPETRDLANELLKLKK